MRRNWQTGSSGARLGWFIGKLGRNKVAVLVGPDVERPSDLSGMMVIPFGAATQ